MYINKLYVSGECGKLAHIRAQAFGQTTQMIPAYLDLIQGKSKQSRRAFQSLVRSDAVLWHPNCKVDEMTVSARIKCTKTNSRLTASFRSYERSFAIVQWLAERNADCVFVLTIGKVGSHEYDKWRWVDGKPIEPLWREEVAHPYEQEGMRWEWQSRFPSNIKKKRIDIRPLGRNGSRTTKRPRRKQHQDASYTAARVLQII